MPSAICDLWAELGVRLPLVSVVDRSFPDARSPGAAQDPRRAEGGPVRAATPFGVPGPSALRIATGWRAPHRGGDVLTWNGETLTLIGWSRRTGIRVQTLLRRCRKGWWSSRC